MPPEGFDSLTFARGSRLKCRGPFVAFCAEYGCMMGGAQKARSATGGRMLCQVCCEQDCLQEALPKRWFGGKAAERVAFLVWEKYDPVFTKSYAVR